MSTSQKDQIAKARSEQISTIQSDELTKMQTKMAKLESDPLSMKDWLAGATILITSFALGTSITNYTTSIRESLVEPLISPIIGSGPDKFTQVGPFKFRFVNLIASTIQFGTMIFVAYGMYRLLQKVTAPQANPEESNENKK